MKKQEKNTALELEAFVKEKEYSLENLFLDG